MPTYLLLYTLTALTGLLHAYIGLATLSQDLGLILLLNGLGYFGLIGLHFMTEWRGYGKNFHNYLLLAYTLTTIIAYFVTFPFEDAISNVVGMATKIDELVIIGLLLRIISKRKIPTATA